MASRQLSITVSEELAAVVDALAQGRGESRSALIEILLREHPYVRKAVHGRREAPDAPAGKGARGAGAAPRRRDGEARVEVA